MDRRYRIGVIGLGARAETFVRQLHAGTPRAELCGVCDVDPDRMRMFLDYCDIAGARTFTDPSALLAQDDMDAVIVTTPDFTHLDVALPAFAAGKHVYLEKPLEVTSARCRAIVEAHRKSGVVAFVGFNLRASPVLQTVRRIVRGGTLGQIVQIDGLEQISCAHIAAFMRRFHRFERQSGGLLNTKSCHDLDAMMWIVGHEHRVAKVASFGGCSVFVPAKRPAARCGECPGRTRLACPYVDRAGFVFPVGGRAPIHKTRDMGVYGGDLCVYNDEKDLVDNQTLILEWDSGTRGSFNLQGFQHQGRRELRIWGEKGTLRAADGIEMILSPSGERIEHRFPPREGGHGGADPLMVERFVDAIVSGGPGESGLAEGLAATLVAEKALESLKTGRVVGINREEYA